MELICIGDLHLTDVAGKGALSKYVQEPDAMVIAEIEKVLVYAKNKGIRNIVLCGDLCENPRMSYSATLALTSLFSKYTEFMFRLILGNHDMYGLVPEAGHSLELIQALYKEKNLRIYTKPTNVNIQNVTVRFLPYPHESFDKKALNIFHKEVRGARGDSGRVMDSDELSNSKSVVVAGHLHTNHRVRNTYYTGTLYQTNFGESLPKYFHHVEFNSVEDYEIQNINHDPTYKLHNIVLSSRSDLALIPKSQFELVKLVIQDGADVSTADYAKFSNIMEVKNFKTKEDLALVLADEFASADGVKFNLSDFFDAWIKSLDVEETTRKKIVQVRRKLLNSLK